MPSSVILNLWRAADGTSRQTTDCGPPPVDGAAGQSSLRATWSIEPERLLLFPGPKSTLARKPVAELQISRLTFVFFAG
jgi:hypothetical protein